MEALQPALSELQGAGDGLRRLDEISLSHVLKRIFDSTYFDVVAELRSDRARLQGTLTPQYVDDRAIVHFSRAYLLACKAQSGEDHVLQPETAS